MHKRNHLKKLIPGRTLVRFVAVGLLGAVIDFGSMRLLEYFGCGALFSRGLSYLLGSLFAYYANSYYTFDGNRSASEKTRAFVVYAVCLVVASGVNKVTRIGLPELPNTILYAWVVSQAAATMLNFVLQKKWVFR